MQEIILAIITSSLPIFLGYIVYLLKEQKKDRNANSKGTMLLLRAQLKAYHKEYMERGYVTSEELADYLEMYEAYHSLGGNGVATKWRSDVEALEVKD